MGSGLVTSSSLLVSWGWCGSEPFPGIWDLCTRGCQGRDASHTGHGAGPGHAAVSLPRAVGVGTGQFRQWLIQGGCCTTFLLARSSCRESRLPQLPDLTHTGGPGAAARPCPSRNTGHPHVLSLPGGPGGRERKGQGRSCSSAANPGSCSRCSAAPAVCASHQVERVLRVAGRPGTLLTV